MSSSESSSKSDKKRYLRLAFKNYKLLLVGILSGGIAGLSSGFGVPFFVDRVFRDIFENQDQNYAASYVVGIAALLPLIFVIRGIAGYINQYFLQWVSQNILMSIRESLFRKTQTLPISYFEARQSGDLMAKMVGDTLQVQHAIHLIAKDGVVQPFTFLAGLGFLTFLSIKQQEMGFILLMILLTPVLIMTVRLIGKKLKKRSRELQETLGSISEIMAENLRGVTEVRAFNLQSRENKRLYSKLKAYNHFAMKMAKYDHMTQPLMEIIAVAMVSIAFLFSYYKGIGFSTFASMGAALYFTVDAAKRIVRIFTGIQRTQGSFERIDSILEEEDKVEDPSTPVTIDTLQGKVEFKEVRFAYDSAIALDIENLTISSGETVALVGPSGAGKSTFARLIPRFYDPVSGSIEIDGYDLRSVRQHDLRKFISIVPQDPVLFNDTVYNNVLLGNESATKEEVIEASKRAFAHEFVEKLENGYDTIVGENAVRLSGGQKQRLALARAFLRNSPILILDEATSALDAESESRIQSALTEFSKDRTVFIIAHRFATIRMAERILLFDKGRIRASGSFQDMLSDALFKKLYDNQNLDQI